ncbi:NADH-quinone oxidoreductase subunit C [Acidocella facilis]|uniref:NADH-quinone oxidoreductase subunit C n=1 Tax=Acidocella facilis TaxID=525 RepID=UPI00047EA420
MAEETDIQTEAPAAPVDEILVGLSALPGAHEVKRALGEAIILTTREAAHALLLALRDQLQFQQVMDVCAVDYPERAQRFEVVYNLLSVTRNQRVRVIFSTDEAAEVASVTDIWPVAGWWEREIWDLFGIRFNGLADHRRILSDYGFEGHPLRKDFPLTGYVEVHYDDERRAVVYDKVKLTQEFRNFDFLSPWEGMTLLPGDEKVNRSRS